ncbi:MAG: hypothetical protein KatS3mg128_0090 [Silanimonas sp.]|nr:MAG: hypothetical protein KatS3mg128_0090 [Silanimonas sp.]
MTMKCHDSLAFVRQALIDYAATLAPSARAGFEQLAQKHFDALVAALSPEPDTPPAAPAEG